jgi:oxygen-independent coproporphyrinogen-3 oxidase
LAGIYIHIPFCRQACHYCNFHFTTSLRFKNEMLTALLKEATMRKEYLQNELVETIYIGGGTPSLLDTAEIDLLVGHLLKTFPVAEDAEITLEANPDDIVPQKLAAWKQTGINRLSLGVQSFFEEDLAWMNRAHDAAQARNAVELAIQQFPNITIDLIYGTPGLSDEKWKRNVETATGFGIPHLSCYALTVEPKTPLHKMIANKRAEDTDPARQASQFLLLMDWLAQEGYEHYEISNFAKPGFRSRHNSAYWQGKNYLGLGPSAHSFNGTSRQWNISNNNIYIDSVSKGILSFEKEILTESQQANENIMISLRTMEGLNLEHLKNGVRESVEKAAKTYLESGHLSRHHNFLRLTREGKLLADGIAAALFIE